MNDICEVIEALDDSNAVKNFILKKVDGLGTELRPFDDPRSHGLREIHDASECVCDGGIDGQVDSQTGQVLLPFSIDRAGRIFIETIITSETNK